MKAKYLAAAGFAIIGFALYYFLRKKNTEASEQPNKDHERRHLTNAFSRAKQVAVGG